MSKFNKFFFAFNFVIVFVIATVVIVYAWTNPSQNPPDGTGVISIVNNNVGIGAPVPETWAKLDVHTTPPNQGIHIWNSTEGGLLLGYQGSTIQGRTSADGNGDLILQKFGGNVGIGAIPVWNKKLYVAGDTQITGSLTAATINTGLGLTEVYPMDQYLRTIDSPTFSTINTGLGATEVYPMNQYLRTIDSPTFGALTVSTINTGLGATEVYPMNQYLRTIDSPTFNTLSVNSLNIGGQNVGVYDGVVNQASDPINWTKLKNVPANFVDGVIAWQELVNVPAGFADGVDNTGCTISSSGCYWKNVSNINPACNAANEFIRGFNPDNDDVFCCKIACL